MVCEARLTHRFFPYLKQRISSHSQGILPALFSNWTFDNLIHSWRNKLRLLYLLHLPIGDVLYMLTHTGQHLATVHVTHNFCIFRKREKREKNRDVAIFDAIYLHSSHQESRNHAQHRRTQKNTKNSYWLYRIVWWKVKSQKTVSKTIRKLISLHYLGVSFFL